MKILITGATGLIGKELGQVLAAQNHRLVIVSRNAQKARREFPYPCEIVEGDLTKSVLKSPQLQDVEVIFHLMGEPVAEGRWTEEKKKSLIASRVQSTRNLRESVGSNVKIVIAASAIGYYGDRHDEELTEDSKPGADFLAELCAAWENEVAKFTQSRCVFVRTGLVISHKGGILKELMTPFRAGAGGPIAGGVAWMSWIHLRDVAGIYVHALKTEAVRGPINACGPHPVRNSEFTKALAHALHRPAFIPIPAFALKLLFGEKAAIILASQKVLPRKAEEMHYQFLFTKLEDALHEEVALA